MELDPRFKIRAPLRCEGIGRLDCAEDVESGMRMAVRWLPLEANGSAAVQACEQLPEHPTLPRIRQIGQMGASAYVAMEFPDGNLLATHLHEPLGPAALIGITAQIADALATIHSQDVFHGEMSADSVLLVSSPSERAYLWDMPLVIANRLTDRRGEDRLMYQLVKAAPYLAPERARGGKASAEADVYALGAIICIAGGAPLPVGDTTLALVHSVSAGTWVPRVPKSIPEPLRSMLERMVDREVRARPTAREVADLFMPPVAAHRTEPEMAAIILPAPTAPYAPTPAMLALLEPIAPPVLYPVPPPPVVASPLLVPPPVLQPSVPAAAEQTVREAVAGSPEANAPAPLIVVPRSVSGAAQPAAAVVLARSVSSGVQLTDNVAVSRELVRAGAVLLSPEEAAKVPRPGRRAPLIVAALMALLVVGLGALALDLSRQPTGQPVVLLPLPAKMAAPQQMAAPVAMAAPSLVAPAPAPVESDDDLLSPLTPRAKRPAAAARRRAPKAEVATQNPAVQAAPSQGVDFGFLEEEQELKRPSF